ncbi:MAG: LON peptidase substrate-binding domain-containing protein [Chloroflexi bacterium]|nr:LON peptidase substrate-binding domain-containing protein [Chloroflexota bacterium]
MEIPLFPLHAVLCPGIVLPLHVFEDRYRALTRHCLATGTPFGIVLIRDGRGAASGPTPVLAGVGALVEIREAGRYADGRYDLLAAATGRFAIDAVDAGRAPYLVADVTPLEDDIGDEARAERLAATAVRRFVRYLELMRTREGETGDALDVRVEIDAPGTDEPEPAVMDLGPERAEVATGPSSDEPGPDDGPVLAIPDDPTVLSYLLSGIVQTELPRRQRLLEAATTVERLEQLLVLLDREVFLLTHRLRCFTPDRHAAAGARRS